MTEDNVNIFVHKSFHTQDKTAFLNLYGPNHVNSKHVFVSQ